MICSACGKESKNQRVCPFCFTPYTMEGPAKRQSTRTAPPSAPTGAGQSPVADAVGAVRDTLAALWAKFRKQSPIVQFSTAGILVVLVLWWATGEEPKFEAGVVQSDIIATPLQRDEALAIIKQTRETALVDIQQDEVFVTYSAATFPVLEEGQLALVQQFAHADEIVEARKRRIFFYNPNGKLFAQADGARGVVLVR